MPNNQSGSNNISLEPRVARVEVGLESLSREMVNLTSIIREQGKTVESQLSQLSIEVTKASGPRKTDWNLIVSFVFLILALGSAVFVPLNNSAQLNKDEIQATQKAFAEHQQLQLHPVGLALLNRAEEQVQLNKIQTDNALKIHQEYDNKEFDALDKKLQTEYSLINAKLESQLQSLDTKIQMEMKLMCEILNNRLSKIELITERQDRADLEELRAWRTKAMGLTDKPILK